MIRAAAIVVLVLGLAACGSSTAAPKHPAASPVEFGVVGGNVMGYSVVISPSGRVRSHGPVRVVRQQLSRSQLASVSRLSANAAGLTSRQCAGTLPDIASEYLRVGGRTIRVHGSCEPRFQRVWDRLAVAVGVKSG